MENSDKEKVKEKLAVFFSKQFEILEEKFQGDLKKLEKLKNSLYESIYGSIFSNLS